MSMSHQQFDAKNVAVFIFAEIQSVAKELHKAQQIALDCKQRLLTANDELSYEEDSETHFRRSLASVDVWNEQVLSLGERLNSWQDLFDIMANMTHFEAVCAVQDEVSNEEKLRGMMGYIAFIEKLHKINRNLQIAMDEKNYQEMLDLYLKIYEPSYSTSCILNNSEVQSSPELLSYVSQIAIIWYNRIKRDLSIELARVMELMRVKEGEDVLCIKYDRSDEENLAKCRKLASLLFTLQPPTTVLNPLITITPTLVCQPLSDVVSVLLQPYKQRFQFHFMSTRKTNRLDKPEWMFTQIINWIKQAHEFISETFQPYAFESGNLELNVRHEFMRGLMMFVMEKVVYDMDEIYRFKSLFGHLIDETLSFEAEMRELFGYPDNLPNVLHVFSQPKYLIKWIALEEDYCEHSLDTILQDKQAWSLLDPISSKDDLKIPVCVDRFVRLLDGIKQRYFDLVQPGKKTQFLSIQMQLIDSFRRRLVQLYNSNMVTASSVLNAVNYLILVLSDWGENVHYLQLYAAAEGGKPDEIKSVFEEPLKELTAWQSSMLKNYAESIFVEMRAAALPYCKENWADMPEHSAEEPFLLTPSAGEMFSMLVLTLHSLHDELSLQVFKDLTRKIAWELDRFLYIEVIKSVKFSPCGAEQFKFDMTRNLFPLFGVYIHIAELLFKKVNNSIKLLTANVGTAILLRETLSGLTDADEERTALAELGVEDFNKESALNVLERRTDLPAKS